MTFMTSRSAAKKMNKNKTETVNDKNKQIKKTKQMNAKARRQTIKQRNNGLKKRGLTFSSFK